MERWIVALAALAMLTGGCAKREPRPQPPVDLPTRMPSEEEAARTGPGAPPAIPTPAPSTSRPGGMVLTPATPGEPARAPGSAAAADSPVTPVIGTQRTGYRVQLFATGDAKLAGQRATEYRSVFADPVYVTADGALYKVQVGNCATHEQADALRRTALALGYEGAFVVEALILAP